MKLLRFSKFVVINLLIVSSFAMFNSSLEQTHSSVLPSNILASQSYTVFLTYPSNKTVEAGLTIPLQWTVQSNANNDFYLYQNGSLVDSNLNPNPNFKFPKSGIVGLLPTGVYNFTLRVVIDYGNGTIFEDVDSKFITVVPQEAPSLVNSPLTWIELIEGYTINDLNWTFTDVSPNNYNIYRNNSIVSTGIWTSNTPITYDDLTGVYGEFYNYTIEVFDQIGLITTHSLNATIINNPIPLFSSVPNNMEYSRLNVNLSHLKWIIDDVDPKNFTLYKDNSIISESMVPFNKTVSYALGNLDLGTYNFTIVVYDYLGQQVINTVSITVSDLDAPVITLFPSSSEYPFGAQIESLTWIAIDDAPSQFLILRNGTQVASGIWNSGSEVSYIPTINNQVGWYNFTIVFYDLFGNSAKNTVIIGIIGEQSDVPIISISENVYVNSIDIIEGSWHSSNLLITDAEILARLYLNNTRIRTIVGEIDSTGMILMNLTYDGISPGNFEWRFTFNKDGYTSQLITHNVTVLKTIIGLSILSTGTLIQGENYALEVQYYFMEMAFSSGLHLTNLVNPSSAVKGEIGFLIINYIDLHGQNIISDAFSSETNSLGRAIFILDNEFTLNIKSLLSFSFSMAFEGYEIQNPTIIENLPLVASLTSNNPSNDFSNILVAFLLILLGSLGIFMLWSYLKERSLLKIHPEEKLNHLLSIKMIIFSNSNGIPLYEGIFEKTETDSIMVAGLSSAISSFLDEFMENKELGLEVIERNSLALLSNRSTESVLMVVSSPKLPNVYHSQITQIHESTQEFLSKDIIKAYKDKNANYEKLIIDAFRSKKIYLNLMTPFKLNHGRLQDLIEDPEVRLPRSIRDNQSFLFSIQGQDFSIHELINIIITQSQMSMRKCAKLIFALEDLQILSD